jgi:hypothetical protein
MNRVVLKGMFWLTVGWVACTVRDYVDSAWAKR